LGSARAGRHRNAGHWQPRDVTKDPLRPTRNAYREVGPWAIVALTVGVPSASGQMVSEAVIATPREWLLVLAAGWPSATFMVGAGGGGRFYGLRGAGGAGSFLSEPRHARSRY
jgi:hypothetical protein